MSNLNMILSACLEVNDATVAKPPHFGVGNHFHRQCCSHALRRVDEIGLVGEVCKYRKKKKTFHDSLRGTSDVILDLYIHPKAT